MRWQPWAWVVGAVVFGWQVGVFACQCVDPPERQGCCQKPACRSYEMTCPSGWQLDPRSVSDFYPCCRTYTASHLNPPCCEWVTPGGQGRCRHYYCVNPTTGQRVAHCERSNHIGRGNWSGQQYICEGESATCSEKRGRCVPLEN